MARFLGMRDLETPKLVGYSRATAVSIYWKLLTVTNTTSRRKAVGRRPLIKELGSSWLVRSVKKKRLRSDGKVQCLWTLFSAHCWTWGSGSDNPYVFFCWQNDKVNYDCSWLWYIQFDRASVETYRLVLLLLLHQVGGLPNERMLNTCATDP